MRTHGYEFDFVISYASEDEAYAKKLQNCLIDGGANVFFAPDYQAELWGKNLLEALEKTYSEKGRFCILIISEAYVQKPWTVFEWRSAQPRFLRIDSDYLLPIRLDDADLPGLPLHIHFQDGRKIPIEEIAKMALKKLAVENAKFATAEPNKTQLVKDFAQTTYKTPETNSWLRTGALFWISYDIQWTYIELMHGGSCDQINRGLRQSYHHANRLQLERGILDRIYKLMMEGARYTREDDWTLERRNQFGSEIRDIFNRVAELAVENENRVTPDGFDAGVG